MNPAARRILGAALVAWLSLAAVDAQAQEGCTPVPEQVATNVDQSTMSVTTTCDDSGIRRYVLRARNKDGAELQEMIVEAADEAPNGSAGLLDVDGDGHHEVEVRGMCGAGPNCMGDLYRVNRKTGELQHFFSGGYSDLSMIDGYLVEAGRASCCSWEYHAYRLDDRAEVRGYDNMDLMVEVGADLSSDDENAPARCKFSQRRGDDWTVIAPPAKQWLALCNLYGETYHLVTPREAREAEKSAAAQE